MFLLQGVRGEVSHSLPTQSCSRRQNSPLRRCGFFFSKVQADEGDLPLAQVEGATDVLHLEGRGHPEKQEPYPSKIPVVVEKRSHRSILGPAAFKLVNLGTAPP